MLWWQELKSERGGVTTIIRSPVLRWFDLWGGGKASFRGDKILKTGFRKKNKRDKTNFMEQKRNLEVERLFARNRSGGGGRRPDREIFKRRRGRQGPDLNATESRRECVRWS